MVKKPKKLTPEEKKFQQYCQEMEPVFRLFDGDGDGVLTSGEIVYFLKAVALPLESKEVGDKLEEYLTLSKFDLQSAVQMCIEIEKVENEAFRLKWEFYSVLHQEGGMKNPLVERKWLANFIGNGPSAITPQHQEYMKTTMEDKQRNKLNTALLEKQMKEQGAAPEEIEKATSAIKSREAELIDLKYLILHQYQYLSTGQIMIKEIADQRKKEKEAEKEKAAKAKK